MDGMLINALIEAAQKKAAGKKLLDLRLGLGYTAALLDDGSAGLAFTFRRELGIQCALVEEAGTLAGRSCAELLPWAGGTNLAKAAIGLAIMNALFQGQEPVWRQGDAIQELKIEPGDTLGMIGYFKPVLERFKGVASRLYIFERNGTEEENVYPDWAANMYLPQCDVVVITATTLLNKTLDHILQLSSRAREIALIGPSAPLCPDVFRKTGITLLAGVVVKKPQRVLQIIGEGGGGLSLGENVEQVFLRF